MDLIAAIGLLSSMVTFEEAGKSWLQIIKERIKKDDINISKWDSDEPLVKRCLDKFKSGLEERYNNYIFSDEEVDNIIGGFFEQNTDLLVNYEEKKQLTLIVKDLFSEYNERTWAHMSDGDKTLHNTISNSCSKIMNKLDLIQNESKKDNIIRFLRAVERSKEIELENIEGLINGEYEIDRDNLVKKINTEAERFISIQGNAGAGKSALCKKLLCEKEYVLGTRAEQLSAVNRVNELWGCDLEDAIQWLNNELLYIFIDAIEFVVDCGFNSFLILQDIYRIAEKYSNVRVITSCRNTDSSVFMKINTKYKIKIYEISDLSVAEVNKIAEKYSIISSLQKNKKYADLLISPFYINLIISGGFAEENINDENDLRNLIWEKIICLKYKCKKYGIIQSSVSKVVENIVIERAKSFSVGVDFQIIQSDILEALHSEGVIVKSENKIRLKYDIFEDICFERYIDKIFDSCHGEYNIFFSEIEKMGRCIFRRYQIWISNKLFVQADRERFIYSLLEDGDIKTNWKKQTEIGIVKSKYCGLFFNEFYGLLTETLLVDLINITNLYAFEAKITNSPLIMQVAPIGVARECLINFIYDKRIDMESNRSSIIKLCDDYTDSLNKSEEGEKKASGTIVYFIEQLIEKGRREKSFYKYEDEIIQLFLIIIKMTEASKEWVKKFVEEMIDEYHSDDRRKDSVSEKILEAVVKKCTTSFAIELPELACKSAETLWKKRESRSAIPYAYIGSDHGNVGAYGLSDNADYFDNKKNGVYNNSFIWLVMKSHFDIWFEWAISFVNNAVKAFSESEPDALVCINIFFPGENKIREYLGNQELWMADAMEHNLPIVLTDIIFAIKKMIINTIKKSTDTSYIKALADYVRKQVYEKSNNILLLSVVESIGMNFQKELPGYAAELASSMELIYYDIRRSGEFIHNPTKELLEKQIMLSFGVPEIERRYEKDDKCGCSLQQYFSTSYIYGDELIKNKCCAIMDYLYDLYDEKSCPNENLQIQKMDFRDVVVKKIDEKTLVVEPKIKGEAKKIIEETEITNKPIEQLTKTIDDLMRSINENDATVDRIVDEIDMLCDKVKENSLIELKFESALILLIANALISTDLKEKQRNKLVEEWIGRIEKLFFDQVYITGANLEIVLLEQLNKNIEDNLKNRILLIMLKCIMNEERSGVISKLSEFVKNFLARNNYYARRVFNTIIKLAEDEMNHQEFNALFMLQEYKEENYQFIPNLTPKLHGVDRWMQEENVKTFESMKNQIIQYYLYEGRELQFFEFDVNKYDISILCNVASCGLDVDDKNYMMVIRAIVGCMVEIWHSANNKMYVHDILDVYQIHKVVSYFQRELNIKDKDPTKIYDLLLKDKDFSVFTRGEADFYEDIFSGFLSAYVDGWREDGKRADIEKKIKILEMYVNTILNNYVKNELEKRLFLCRGRYTYWDADKVHTEYSFRDKCFLNAQIKKYGTHHLEDVLYTIYLFNIEKLLPEILISISLCFKNNVADKGQFVEDITKSQSIVDMIILTAFIKYSDEIKNNEKLTNAYEEILMSLTEIGNEKAAVLLDEFRIH